MQKQGVSFMTMSLPSIRFDQNKDELPDSGNLHAESRQ